MERLMSNTTSILPVITPGGTPTTTAQSPAVTSSGLLHAAGDYFETTNGQAVYLAGDHTWTDNIGYASTGQFNFSAYTDDLHSEGVNFMRLWAPDSFANAANSNFGAADQNVFQYAAGSTTKFDLTQFNQSYFDNLLSNVQTAAAKGIYVDVMLFFDYNPPGFNYGTWASNPWNGANNVNGTTTYNVAVEQGIDPKTVALQQAYIAKVLDTLKGQPNVLYEVANEARYDPQTYAWQNQIIDFVHQYEASHGYMQHPVGMSSLSSAGSPTTNSNDVLNAAELASHADWVSPTGGAFQSNPPPATGTKVLVADTDHIFGMGGNSDWVWQQFTRGNNVLMMDDEAGTNLPGVLNTGISGGALSNEISERLGVTETRTVRRWSI
jgi:hypothetical protein